MKAHGRWARVSAVSRIRSPARVLVTVLAVVATLLIPCPAGAQQATGRQGPPFERANGVPTARPEESKIWWNDGHWWASLWSERALDFHLFRLDGTAWVDTGVAVDTRQRTRADALAAGKRLFIVSHRFNRRGAPDGSVLFRYTYDARSHRYVPDGGFPAVVNRYGSETLVLAREGTGRLWVTWTQRGRVWLSRTRCTPGCDDRDWGKPTPIALPEARVAGDDVSSIVSLPGDRVAIMWSNQRLDAFFYVEFENGRMGELEPVDLVESADDHLSLKADSQGRVYAAIKTTSTTPADLLTGLLVRDPDSGEWHVNLFGRTSDGHTRPVVVVNEEAGIAHVLAMAPAPEGGPAQAVYRKSTNLEATEPFPVGPGELVLAVSGGSVMDPTSTKQTVDDRWGLLVLASEIRGKRYAFKSEAPGGVLSAVEAPDVTGNEPAVVQSFDDEGRTRGWLLPVVVAASALAALTVGAVLVQRRK